MNLKKILPIVIVALVAFFLIDQPDQMANLLRSIIHTLGDGAQAVITFAKQLTR